jgi:trans-aconitate methyltransferase
VTEPADLARSFGRVAEEYDRWRPGYPSEAVAWIAGEVAGRTAVEIGAGTGKATVEFLRMGFTVTAVEPDAAMAAVGEARVPGADWVVASAETWPGAESPVDLIYGAQSWHWVPEQEDARLAASLAADGAMAWMWNHPHLGPEEELFGDVYARYMPDHGESRRVALHRRDTSYWQGRMAGVAPDVQVFELPWERRLSADDYVALIATYSDHITLPPEDRAGLQAAIRDRLMGHGGVIELSYLTRVYLGRRRAA